MEAAGGNTPPALAAPVAGGRSFFGREAPRGSSELGDSGPAHQAVAVAAAAAAAAAEAEAEAEAMRMHREHEGMRQRMEEQLEAQAAAQP